MENDSFQNTDIPLGILGILVIRATPKDPIKGIVTSIFKNNGVE